MKFILGRGLAATALLAALAEGAYRNEIKVRRCGYCGVHDKTGATAVRSIKLELTLGLSYVCFRFSFNRIDPL